MEQHLQKTSMGKRCIKKYKPHKYKPHQYRLFCLSQLFIRVALICMSGSFACAYCWCKKFVHSQTSLLAFTSLAQGGRPQCKLVLLFFTEKSSLDCGPFCCTKGLQGLFCSRFKDSYTSLQSAIWTE